MSTKDGLSSSSMFNPASIGVPGSTLACSVIPSDSYGDGTSRSSNVITLIPTPAVASGLQVSPIRASNVRLDTENLGAYYIYTQADGLAEAGSQIRWYMNGTLQAGLNDQLSVPAATTQMGQTWYFTVVPRFVFNSVGILGDMQTSPTVTIRGNAAPVTGLPTLDSANGGTDYNDEDLTTTAAATTDADTDVTTNIFHWTKNGASQTNLQMPFDTEVPTIPNTNGATKDYSGYNNNGQVNGSTWIQDGVVGGALGFDGNDYLQVQEVGSTLGGDGGWSQISVEFWIKTSSTSTETVLLMHDAVFDADDDEPLGVGYWVDYRGRNDGYQVYWYVANTSAVNAMNFRVYEGAGQWHHVVCTYQSGVGLKIYTDGILRTTLAATGNINATADDLLNIGGLGTTGNFVGSMDEVRIYPNALSAAQIFQRYVETKDGLTANNTIVPQETTVADSWICQVIPNDSWQDGATQTSNALNVVAGNGMPHIDWYSTANSVSEGATLNLNQVSSDPNADVLSYSWTLDTVEQATTANWT
ncbi:MAG: LamG domain-containing protein, partial [Actinomycetota bacterium]